MNLDEMGAGIEQERKDTAVISENPGGLEGPNNPEGNPENPLDNEPGINWRALIFAETGPGSIDDYIQHPLNWKESRGLAQVIRGLTGMFDSLRYAIIDIIMGGYRFAEENKSAGNQPNTGA